jgi:hypothetical protein
MAACCTRFGRYARTCPDGDHDALVVRGYLFIYLRPAEPVLRTRGSSGAAMSQMVGAGAQVPRGGSGAAPGWEAGVGATGARGGPGSVLSWEAGVRATGSPEAVLTGRREPLS